MNKPINEVLKQCVGRKVEISIIHHVEGIARVTKGKLIEVTDDLLVMDVECKDHFWYRTKKMRYNLNRHVCSLQSVVLL